MLELIKIALQARENDQIRIVLSYVGRLSMQSSKVQTRLWQGEIKHTQRQGRRVTAMQKPEEARRNRKWMSPAPHPGVSCKSEPCQQLKN